MDVVTWLERIGSRPSTWWVFIFGATALGIATAMQSLWWVAGAMALILVIGVLNLLRTTRTRKQGDG
ncbi:hypothetical protein [Microbacterium sp. P05]|uniref:hypothetical protein n=1 Tax=Microbacterium sp. P05 TaxID=3366948 RepID=UPI0037464EE2